MTQLRILHVLDHSIPLHSGYTFRTLGILREQHRLGWQTFQLTSPKQFAGDANEEVVDGLHFYRTPSPSRPGKLIPGVSEFMLMRQLEHRLLQIAEKLRPQVLHAHSPVLNALPAVRVGRRLGIPVVYEVRAFWEDAAVDHGTTHEGSLRYRFSRALETRALNQVSHAFTICEGLRRDIVARGVRAAKVTVIPNAVDVDAFNSDGIRDAALARELGQHGCTVIGFIGSFYAYEGLDLLLDAMPRLLSSRPDVRLLLVGGGPQDAELKSHAQSLGLGDKVVFAGRVAHAQVQRYYDLVDVLAYPRRSMRLTELVTPLKPLEAMAQGRMLVASDVGGHRELIRDGVTGFLFRADNAESLTDRLLQALGQRDLWPRMRDAGRRYVETERTWRASVERYRAAYEALFTAQAE
jgi:PEP-CTERM/exosortase A-associated glycosyltransferase